MMRSFRTRVKQDNRGFVVVLMAISMLALITIMGFAVDVGSWYLSASRLQRAADSAALAGAISLPDATAATDAITTSAAFNDVADGSNGGSVHVVPAITSNQVSVTISNSNVDTYFTHMFLPHISISRTSVAVRGSDAPALGSPFNVLGAGPTDTPNTQNFWLAINGRCAPKEDGDYFEARNDRNKVGLDENPPYNNGQFTDPGTAYHDPTSCSGAIHNPSYNSAVPGTGDSLGYTYKVDVPPQTAGTVKLEVYDGSLNGRSLDGAGNPQPGKPLDNELNLANENGGFDTLYVVYGPDGNPRGNPSSFASDSPLDPSWQLLYKLTNAEAAVGGTYTIQVVEADGELSWGANSFSLGAFRTTKTSHEFCTTLGTSDPTCPQVYANGTMSVFTDTSDITGKSQFYFAEIDPSYIGQTFHIYLWDPGEGVKGIELHGPDNTAPSLPFTWIAQNGAGVQDGSGSVVAGGAIDTSGTFGCNPGQPYPADPCAGLSNNFKYNDHLLTLTVTLPNTYLNQVNTAHNDWLKLQYNFKSAGSPNDRTTWGLDLNGGTYSPPHLTGN